MWKYTQHSFAGGQIDRDLMGRQDLAKYFIGATTLQNFVVKRQGCLEKRRGTELIADLDGLLGTDEEGNAIALAQAVVIPFVYEREGGYTILLAAAEGQAAKLFVCSGEGILLDRTRTKQGDEEAEATVTTVWSETATKAAETETETDPETQATTTYAVTYAPHALAVPYRADELADIAICQSGDTMWLAHTAHPFARITRATDGTFTYEAIDFAAMGATTQLYPPTIKATSSGQQSGAGNAMKTVSYVATYVKDGVESAPSVPVYISYRTPWATGLVVDITCERGANESEPDYYNVYKKVGGDYGFIGKTGDTYIKLGAVKPLSISGLQNMWNREVAQIGYMNWDTENGYGLNMVDTTEKLFSGFDSPSTGGAQASGKAEVSFAVGSYFSEIVVTLDYLVYKVGNHPVAGQSAFWENIRCGGTRIALEITVTDGKTSKTFKKTGNVSEAPSGEQTRIFGWDVYPSMPQNWPRSVKFNFKTEIESAFPNGGAWCSKFKIGAENSDGTPATLVVQQFVLYGQDKDGNTFYDDYITPDVSLTPPVTEEHFAATGDYPGCVALYNQRLALAATAKEPFTIQMSCVGDLYNFNTHSALREDDAIEATIPATEFPEVNHMVMNKDLVLFCDSGEWVISPTSGNTLSYKTIQIKMQSQIGCAKNLPPLVVADEILFAESTARTLRAIKYDFTADGYTSTDLSVLSQDIFQGNPIVDMEYKQHPDSEIVCVLQDGTLAILSYMREHELAAWGTHTLGGGMKALGICSDKAMREGTTDTYLLVARTDGDGTHHALLRIRPTTEATDVRAAVCLDAIRWVTATAETTIPERAVAVDLLTGQAVQTLTAGREYAIGYPYAATFRSVRPEAQGESTIQFELKNATSAELRLLDASPVRVVPTVLEQATQNQWMDAGPAVTPDAEGNLALRESDVLVNLAGVAAEDGALTLKSETHWPLKVLSFSVNYEFDPRLINQEG